MFNILQGALHVLAQATGEDESVTQAASSLGDAASSGLVEAASTASAAATSAPPLLDMSTQQLADAGMLHFVAQSDMIGKSLFVILIIMSLISWYLIFVKSF